VLVRRSSRIGRQRIRHSRGRARPRPQRAFRADGDVSGVRVRRLDEEPWRSDSGRTRSARAPVSTSATTTSRTEPGTSTLDGADARSRTERHGSRLAACLPWVGRATCSFLDCARSCRSGAAENPPTAVFGAYVRCRRASSHKGKRWSGSPLMKAPPTCDPGRDGSALPVSREDDDDAGVIAGSAQPAAHQVEVDRDEAKRGQVARTNAQDRIVLAHVEPETSRSHDA
jgi:hypothetical protein